MPIGALIGATVVGVGGQVLSNKAQNQGATNAANAQGDAAVKAAEVESAAAIKAAEIQAQLGYAGIAEQTAAREKLQELLSPYVAAGGPALAAQMDYLGLGKNGAAGQAAFINQQKNNPIFQGLLEQGADTILANASATGGLRGGDVQSALGSYSSQLLNQFVTDQYNRLGGFTQMGQNSAAGIGTAGMTSASQISQLLGGIGNAQANALNIGGQASANAFNTGGQAQAGAYLARGQNNANMYGGIANQLGSLLGMGGF
jgi:hypothetical protein